MNNSMITYGSIVGFLETNNLTKTAKALKDDLNQDLSHFKADPQMAEDLFKLMKKVVNVKDNREMKPKGKELIGPEKRRPGAKTLTPEETENVMAGFLNKLMNKQMQTTLPIEKMNPKMEKFLNNTTFKRMAEKSEALHDVSNISVLPNQGQKEMPSERRREEKKSVTEASWDQRGQNPPFTGKPDLSDMLNDQDFSPNQQKAQAQKGKPLPEPKIEPKKPVKIPHEGGDRSRRNHGESFARSEGRSVFDVMDPHTGNIPSIIHPDENDNSITHSFVIPGLEDPYANAVDDYVDDDDPGFDLYEVAERDFVSVAKQLADKYGFPARGCLPGPDKGDNNKDKDTERNRNQFTPTDDSGLILQELKNKKDGKDETTPKNSSLSDRTDKDKKPKGYIHLPQHLKHPSSNDSFYPVVFENVIFDCFNMRVIYDRERTGFEETKDFPIVINSIVAGRYQILQYLGSAAFSKAIECLDMVTNNRVCMKVIENNKDYFDQSVDEIKLLKFINHNADVDEKCVLKFYDFFYHKEHLFIVTELLKENLYEYQKLNKERDQEQYFTVGRLQKITRQILTALDYIHGLNLIHCDLKPENILLKDYENSEIKVIDFGSSCFIHDHLSSYVQSRSYRAPEVIIGCKYDYKVDMWSLGCILAELWTGNVLFQNDTVQGLLARVIGIIGPFPEHMTKSGRLTHNFFTKEKLLYQEAAEEGESQALTENSEMMGKKRGKTGRVQILVPKRSSLKHRLRTNDLYFLDFVRGLLEIDPAKRPSAREAMNHPWITDCRYNDPPVNPKKQ